MRQTSYCTWGASEVGAPTTWGADWDYYGTANYIIITLCSTPYCILKILIVTMELILPNITEKRCGVALKIKNSTVWLPKSVSHILTSSSVWIAKKIIKQIAIAILTGTIVLTGVSMIENHRNSFESRIQ